MTSPVQPTGKDLASARKAVQSALTDAPPESPARATRWFSYVLDELVTVPGTKMRVGLDPVLSLMPWVGTAVGIVFGGVILVDAVRLRAPVSVLARMATNSLLDWLLGLIPFIGAFFDLTYRSNVKNLKLLNRTIENRELVRKASLRYWIMAVGLLVLLGIVVVAIPVFLLLSVGGWLLGR